MAVCATERATDAGVLHEEELALVEGASPGRLAEFATGRWCAHGALAALLGPAQAALPVLADGRGAPVWPPGVVGSITHCMGWTGAVAAQGRAGRLGRGVAGVGIDAEPAGPLPEGVLEVVASEHERGGLDALRGRDPGVPWETVLHSAKESAYKAAYPLLGLVLSHDDVVVDLSADGRFRATSGVLGPARVGVRGRWTAGPAVVLTLAVVP
jgi:4'-phosphopantetheinyl transferase EntD